MILKVVVSALCLFFCTVSLVCAESDASEFQLFPPGKPIETYHIPNTENIVDAYLIVKSGAYARSEKEGISHYLEHLVWMNARDGASIELSSLHGFNAWTSGEATVYRVSADSSDIEKLIHSISMVFDTPDTFSDKMLEERQIILREYETRTASDLLFSTRAKLRNRAFGTKGRGRSVLGTPESILSMLPEEAFAVHQLTHQPQNAVLIITGKLDLENLKSLISKYFNLPSTQIKSKQIPRSRFNLTRDIQEKEVHKFNSEILLYLKRINLQTSVSKDLMQLRLNFLSDILNSTLDGSLAKPLRYDAFISSGYTLTLGALERDEIVVSFSARPDVGVSLQNLLLAFEQHLKTLEKTGIPSATFDRVRTRKLNSISRVFDDWEFALDLIISQIFNDAPIISPEKFKKRLSDITLDELNSLAGLLAGPGLVVGTLVQPISTK
ncbi:MAG: hypothetical protein COA52_18615 [Hyphomicrobiales bacterium]|nr:insulinase family protein [Hyphomicrobiales bacterium]PCJ83577.1 MAG: hypothetical protein COA52_18615 [Hyphomicrobiales bacterium]